MLVVEDDPHLRMITAAIIEDAGFRVIEAGNADDAVMILETQTDIHLVFTDIDMPGSMDGIKLAAAVRGRWPPIEIIVTSGHRRVRIEDLPVRGVFLPKPYDTEQLLAAITALAA